MHVAADSSSGSDSKDPHLAQGWIVWVAGRVRERSAVCCFRRFATQGWMSVDRVSACPFETMSLARKRGPKALAWAPPYWVRSAGSPPSPSAGGPSARSAHPVPLIPRCAKCASDSRFCPSRRLGTWFTQYRRVELDFCPFGRAPRGCFQGLTRESRAFLKGRVFEHPFKNHFF